MMKIIRCIRPDDIVDCIILKYKDSGKYSWINLTKEHICPCKFDSYEECYDDIDRFIESGKVNKVEEIEFNTKKL